MKVYNAKEEQICNICEMIFDHNKQGRFKSHLENVRKSIINALLATT